jgi:hypothetical protein
MNIFKKIAAWLDSYEAKLVKKQRERNHRYYMGLIWHHYGISPEQFSQLDELSRLRLIRDLSSEIR